MVLEIHSLVTSILVIAVVPSESSLQFAHQRVGVVRTLTVSLSATASVSVDVTLTLSFSAP